MVPDAEKRDRIKKMMDKNDLDVIISKYTENVLYFTNVWPITGWGICFTFRDGSSILYIPDSEMDFTSRAVIDDIRPYAETSLEGLKAILYQVDIKGKKIGLELSKEGLASSHLGYEVAFPNEPTFDLIKKICSDSSFIDATRIIEEMRACKTNFELRQLKLV
nr:aminopeptidase P family N-terminal domain-containing protein [Candidatus Sigynarchaeota archaeon]